MTERLQRLCDLCGVLDDLPRHIHAVPAGTPEAVPSDDFVNGLPDGVPAHALRDILDPGTLIRHHSCCAKAGCPDCSTHLAAHGASTDAELLAALNTNPAQPVAPEGLD